MKKLYVVAGHATVVNGSIHEVPVNTLYEELIRSKQDLIHIRHSIDGSHDSSYFTYDKGTLKGEYKLRTLKSPSVLRYLSEVVATYKLVKRRQKSGHDTVYIGADPLNALAGVLLKRAGYARKAVFYTVDYSDTRFNNRLLNYAYHLIDRFCVNGADEVWNVSSRIVQKRKAQGLPDNKNIYVPNVPSNEYQQYLSVKRHPHTLVTLGIISEQLDFENLFKAIKDLARDFADIRLKIIGSGPLEGKYKRQVKKMGLDNRVKFYGFLSHQKALAEIASSGVGLALYNGNWSFNHYGDSMKCREFFCFGLPVLTTNTHSTVEDVNQYKSGVVAAQAQADYIAALRNIWHNYGQYSDGSFALAKKYNGVHKRVLSKL